MEGSLFESKVLVCALKIDRVYSGFVQKVYIAKRK